MSSNNLIHLTFGLQGINIKFTTNNNNLMLEIRKDFGKMQIESISDSNGSLRVIQTRNKLPINVPKYAIRDSLFQSISIYTSNAYRYRIKKESQICQLNLESNTCVLYYKESVEISFVRFLLKWLLIKSLERKGFAFIHGSGVIKDDISLLFIGPSRFGKTHTLLTFLQSGYKLITDDNIFYKNKLIFPVSLRSRISSNMFDLFPMLKHGRGHSSSGHPDGGELINLSEIFPFQETELHPSKLFYMYVWNAPETRIERVPKKEMLARLIHLYKIEWENSMWFNYNEEQVLKQVIPVFYSFIKGIECYKVFGGTDNNFFIDEMNSVI